VPSGRHSAKFEFFFKKNSLPSAMVTALGKTGKNVIFFTFHHDKYMSSNIEDF